MSTTTSVYGLVKHARGDTPWDVEVNADFDSIDAELARGRIPFLSPTVGATTTCDLHQTSGARFFVFTVSQVTTVAFTNIPTSSFAVTWRLLVTNGGAFAVTWPAAVTWFLGHVPTLQTSGVDLLEFVTRDGGTTIYGRHVSPLAWKTAAAVTVAQILPIAGSRAFTSRIGNTATLATPVGQPVNTTNTNTTVSSPGSPVNLFSYAIPADALNVNGQGIRFRAIGTAANNANAKTVRIALGATQILSVAPQVSVADVWQIELEVFRTGATTADCWAWGLTKGTGVKVVEFVAVAGLSDWTSTGNTIQLSCTQVATADLTQEGQMVEWLGV